MEFSSWREMPANDSDSYYQQDLDAVTECLALL
jgi:hypothetical protein